MIAIEVKIDQAGIDAIKEKGRDVTKELVQRMKRAELTLERYLKITAISENKRTVSKGYVGFTGSPRMVQTISAGGSPVTSPNGDVEGKVRIGTPYAAARNWGPKNGVISAKNVTYLTIPLPGLNYGPAKKLMLSGLTFIHKDVIYLKAKSSTWRQYRPTFVMGLSRKSALPVIPVYVLRPYVKQTGSSWIDKGISAGENELLQILTGKS